VHRDHIGTGTTTTGTTSNESNISYNRRYNNRNNNAVEELDDIVMDEVMSEEEEDDVDDTSDDDDDNMSGMVSRATHNSNVENSSAAASIVDLLSSSGTMLPTSTSAASSSARGTSTSSSSMDIVTNSSINNNTELASSGNNGNDPESEKRREIQSILRDISLSSVEKNTRIQRLMDGRKKKMPDKGKSSRVGLLSSSGFISSSSVHNLMDDVQNISCVHYDRKCVVVSPCCHKVFGCRVCHDESVIPNGSDQPTCKVNMDRFAITEIICKDCKTRQPCSNKCINCSIQFAEYHCPKCNIWMSHSKRPFHCDQCGFCRVGGRDAFRHCATCCMCISVTVYETHNCMKDKYKNNCPVCTEDMFSSRQAPQDLPCGHAIHAHCFRKLAGFDYRCPVCKKTVVSRASMAAAWNARARDIAMQPMPPDLARKVHIMCNDCEIKSENCDFHFLGVQCPKCNSFNTQQLSTTIEGDGDTSDGIGGASGDGIGDAEGDSDRPNFSGMTPTS